MQYTSTGIRKLINDALAAASPPKTGRVWLPADVFQIVEGAPNAVVTGVPGTRAWLLDADASEAVVATAVLPPGWLAFHVDMWWFNINATNTGDVRVRATVTVSTADAAGMTTISTGSGVAAPAGSQYVYRKTRVQTLLTATEGALYRVHMQRNATDATDTLPNDIGALGIELVRAS